VCVYVAAGSAVFIHQLSKRRSQVCLHTNDIIWQMGGTHYWAQSLQVVHMWYMVVQGSSWNEQLNSSSFLVGPAQAPLWAQLKLRGGPNSSSLVGPAQAPWWAQLKLPCGPSSSSLVGPAQAPWWAQLKLPGGPSSSSSGPSSFQNRFVWCTVYGVSNSLCVERVIPSDIFFSWYPCSHIWKQVLLVQ